MKGIFKVVMWFNSLRQAATCSLTPPCSGTGERIGRVKVRKFVVEIKIRKNKGFIHYFTSVGRC